MRTGLSGIALAVLLLLLASCRKEGERGVCMEPRQVALRLRCVQKVDTATRDTALRSPVLVPVGGQAGVRYSSPTTLLQLYLSPLEDSCRYLLAPDSVETRFDTLTLFYTRQLRFISDACGFTTYFELQSARTSTVFSDSVLITNPLVDNNANSTPHLQLYFHRP